MKVLIINDSIVCGGAEKISLNIKELLKSIGYNVFFLSFDKNFQKNIKEINIDAKEHININTSHSKINKLFFNPFLYFKIKKQLTKVKPDVIILNTIFCSPFTQLLALKNYKVIQIVHDYSIVCPKSICIYENGNICEGYNNSNKCIRNCKYHNSKLNIFLKLYQFKILKKVRKKIITKFIAPSKKLNDYLKKHGYNSTVINNPIYTNSNKKKMNHFRKGESINYIYIGQITEGKGIFKFLEMFDVFSIDKNVKLEVIGKFENNKQENHIIQKYKKNKKIIFRGYLSNKDVINEISQNDFLVIPSILMENYPTTALEAMSNRICVIGSNRGGIPEILDNDRGFIMNMFDKKNVETTLLKTLQLSEEEYYKIVENAYNYVRENNSEKLYVKKLNEEIKRILNK